jgi:DNA polymerase-4
MGAPPEEARWWVLHVDMDQFVVAVELHRHPELRDRPVLVGGTGDPSRRGVVSGASYEARRFGIRSGTPLRTAAARCPHAAFLPVDAEHYRDVSGRVMAALRRFPLDVEVLGWDEAFLGATVGDPEGLAHEVQSAVRASTGLSCSVGIGENRLHAKTASVLAKPGGVVRLTGSTWAEVMGDRPVEQLWGVGPRTAARLRALDVRTVANLAATDVHVLTRTFGPQIGKSLHATACGRASATVTAVPRRQRSHGRQVTYQHDLTDREQMRREVRDLARRLIADLPGGRHVGRVIVTVRFHPFDTHSHGVPLAPAGTDASTIERAALEALDLFALDRPVRLLGVRCEFATPASAARAATSVR